MKVSFDLREYRSKGIEDFMRELVESLLTRA